MTASKRRLRMGSQLSSPDQKSTTSYTSTTDDKLIQTRRTRRYRHAEATNTNAREHTQPDRLKLLFREQRGYRALSEQKVTEWLSKNKEFYTVMPKDLTEIPDQIFSPMESMANEKTAEKTYSNPSKSERSGHTNPHGHADGHSSRRPRDKMNHYMQRTSSKHHTHHSSVMIHKHDSSHTKRTKSSSKRHRNMGKLDSDTNHFDESTTSADGLSPREFELLSGRRHRLTCSRRESHCLAPRSSTMTKRPIDPWPANSTILASKRGLPSMVQNNALNRQRLKLRDSVIEPVSSLQQSLSLKRSSDFRRQGLCSIPKRERLPKRVELGKDFSTQDSHVPMRPFQKPRSRSVMWQSPATIKRLQKIATMWVSRRGKLQ
ncbi:hypothetical protein CSKR_103044 [Clonorchis sinensis]|uniref:Uncharacterized protein n=1 Tax=Clonorchis sinensis TaxID=79923 RepID=A0A3R7D3L5_CLOSI|nr:hypothetical protein CSKR_103044 [Clonorchis sinensis]